jgi:hypothetical protein
MSMPTVATINITDKSPEILKAMRRQVLLGLE